MANDIVPTLFGISPFEAQQKQRAAELNYASTYAQLDPFAAAKMSLGQAGAGLANIGAGMMGMVNPEVEAAKQRETIMAQGGTDLSTPEGLFAKAKQFADAGDQQTALKLTLLGRQAQAQNVKESPYAKIDPKDYTPESLKIFVQTHNPANLVAREKTQFESMSNEEKLVSAAAKSQGLVEGTPEWNKFTATAYQKLMDKKTNINVNTGGQASQKPMTAAQQVKFENQLADDFKSAEQVMQNSQNIVQSISDISGSKGLSARTGYTGYVPAWAQGKEAMTAQNRIETLKGKVTQMGKSMATMSGAIGPMAVQEWKIVSDAVNAIDPTAGNFNEQLANVQSQAEGTAKRIKDMYDRQYSDYFEKYPKFQTQNLKTYLSSGGEKPDGAGTGDLVSAAKAELARRQGKK